MPELPEGWVEQDGRLLREFRFADFATAMAFVADVAQAAEAQDHHPQWTNLGASVRMELWSHDIGGISKRDHRLAQSCHEIAARLEQGSTCRFTVLYRWRLHPDQEETFRQGWAGLTHHIAQNLGGLGSRLHRLDDGTHAAYAQWPSRALWEAAQAPSSEPPNPQVQEWQEQMRQAVAETLPTTTMDVAEDLLKARFLGPRGD